MKAPFVGDIEDPFVGSMKAPFVGDMEELIPQRGGMVVVDALLHCDVWHTKTVYHVETEGLFVEDGRLSAVGLLENMAQTTAARMGYLALYGVEATGVVRKGVIGAIRNFIVYQLPECGETLCTSIDLVEELGDIILVEAKVKRGKLLCAGCTMIVSLI